MGDNILLKALRGENRAGRPPIWLMRQAGRYMPEYQKLKEGRALLDLFHDHDAIVEITQLPAKLLGVDALILFSDILVIAEVFGLSISFPDKGGPRVEPPIQSASQVESLKIRSVQDTLWYVFETIRKLKKILTVPLIGFSGAPFTVASYLIDSTSKNAFEHTRRWIKEDPETLHALLIKITEVTIAYLKAQIKSGVDAIQIFDSWANILNDEEFALFSLPYLNLIVKAIKEGLKVIVIE